VSALFGCESTLAIDSRTASSARVYFPSDQGFQTLARSYSVPLIESFQQARSEYPGISVDPEIMSGAPCIAGTRVPVYMILDAIEYHGSVEGAVRSYPRLTVRQLKDALGFAKSVLECPIDDRSSPVAR
jgi:uncharacterized protein (DUF433 family)